MTHQTQIDHCQQRDSDVGDYVWDSQAEDFTVQQLILF
jgi:hypothetical protein